MDNIKIINFTIFFITFFSIVLFFGTYIINYTPKRTVTIVRNYPINNKLNDYTDKANINLKILNNFITRSESKHLIRLANKRLKRSNIVDDKNNNSKSSNVRTSKSAFFGKSEYKFLKEIEERAARLLKVKLKQIEPIQIVKYEPGEQYDNHYDWFKHPKKTRDSKGQRLKTIFVYLNDDYEGGETAFPKLDYKYKGNKGDAIFWNNVKNGKPDMNTLHRGNKIISGTKYGMNIWIREH